MEKHKLINHTTTKHLGNAGKKKCLPLTSNMSNIPNCDALLEAKEQLQLVLQIKMKIYKLASV